PAFGDIRIPICFRQPKPGASADFPPMRIRPAFHLAAAVLPLAAPAREITVEARPFSVAIEVEARLVPERKHEFRIAPQSETPWFVDTVAPHASLVGEGDSILQADIRELDRQLA